MRILYNTIKIKRVGEREIIDFIMLYTIEPRCIHLIWKRIIVKTSWLSTVPVYVYCREFPQKYPDKKASGGRIWQ